MKRYIPLLIILTLMAVVYFTGLYEFLAYEELKAHRENLKQLVQNNPLTAPLLFIGIYTIATALSVPGGIFLSIFGGFLFPQPWSTLYVVTAATIGATIIFFAAKTALGDYFKDKAGPRIQKMRKGFQENEANYLLFLRLVPLFPFWLVNIAPAFFGVGLKTFVWTTFIGIIPGAFVFTQAGVGLGAILDSGESLNLDTIFNTQVKIALIALALFAILPVIIKKVRRS